MSMCNNFGKKCHLQIECGVNFIGIEKKMGTSVNLTVRIL